MYEELAAIVKVEQTLNSLDLEVDGDYQLKYYISVRNQNSYLTKAFILLFMNNHMLMFISVFYNLSSRFLHKLFQYFEVFMRTYTTTTKLQVKNKNKKSNLIH